MRRRYLKGKYEDANKYFKCPQCGFILSDISPSDRMSKSITEAQLTPNVPYGAYGVKDILVLDTLTSLGSVKRYKEEQSVSIRIVTINRGCPFCGNVNF